MLLGKGSKQLRKYSPAAEQSRGGKEGAGSAKPGTYPNTNGNLCAMHVNHLCAPVPQPPAKQLKYNSTIARVQAASDSSP